MFYIEFLICFSVRVFVCFSKRGKKKKKERKRAKISIFHIYVFINIYLIIYLWLLYIDNIFNVHTICIFC